MIGAQMSVVDVFSHAIRKTIAVGAKPNGMVVKQSSSETNTSVFERAPMS